MIDRLPGETKSHAIHSDVLSVVQTRRASAIILRSPVVSANAHAIWADFQLAFRINYYTVYLRSQVQISLISNMLILLQQQGVHGGPTDAVPSAALRREAADGGGEERDHAPHRHDGHRHRRLRPRGGRGLYGGFLIWIIGSEYKVTEQVLNLVPLAGGLFILATYCPARMENIQNVSQPN